MHLDLLISTIDGGIAGLNKVLLPEAKGVSYKVSHQVTEEEYRPLPDFLKRPDVKVVQIEGRGLCRNRNSTIKMAAGDIALLADDDVSYRLEYFESVRQAFLEDPGLDVACFKIYVPGGEEAYKEYSPEPYLLNSESRHYISTIEIAFKVKSIKEKGLFFDERFGLGSPLNSFGEEAVFIFDCIKAGLKVKFVPSFVVEHPKLSTIKSTSFFDEVNTVFKGAYDARRFGYKAVPAAFYDLVRYHTALAAEGKPALVYLKERLQGARYILKGRF